MKHLYMGCSPPPLLTTLPQQPWPGPGPAWARPGPGPRKRYASYIDVHLYMYVYILLYHPIPSHINLYYHVFL